MARFLPVRSTLPLYSRAARKVRSINSECERWKEDKGCLRQVGGHSNHRQAVGGYPGSAHLVALCCRRIKRQLHCNANAPHFLRPFLLKITNAYSFSRLTIRKNSWLTRDPKSQLFKQRATRIILSRPVRPVQWHRPRSQPRPMRRPPIQHLFPRALLQWAVSSRNLWPSRNRAFTALKVNLHFFNLGIIKLTM